MGAFDYTPLMKVLFVCLGNICRSPAAEGIFRKMIQDRGLVDKVFHDSAGTGGWHVGHPPDGRMMGHARERGYELGDLKARRFQPVEDFKKFDLILTMDESNFTDVRALTTSEEVLAKVRPMTSYCRIHEVDHVPDPYYRDEDGFELVLDILEDACEELVKEIERTLK